MTLEIQEEVDRPTDEYDLSALYLLIGADFLVPMDEKLDLVGNILRQTQWMVVSLVRITNKLYEEIEQRRNQMLNLERRLFALEEKAPGKIKHYKQYTT